MLRWSRPYSVSSTPAGEPTLRSVCGRYAASRSPDDLVEEFELDRVDARLDVRERLDADWNVAPTKPVPAIITRHPHGDKDAPPVRQLTVLRWGLVPSWAKDPAIGNRMINARSETVADKPAFKRAFAKRRCLLPADGFYEWYVTEQRTAKGKPVKQPFFIHRRDGGVLAMAGLYEIWRDPAKDRDDHDAFWWTSTVLTTQATDDLGRLHDRMPLLVAPQDREAWLDPALDGGGDDRNRLLGLLDPALPSGAGAEGHGLEAYPVSREVNNVRNNGAQLVEPLAVDAEPDAEPSAEAGR